MSTLSELATGSFTSDADHSSYAFAVDHMGVSTFRGSFGNVDARAKIEGGQLTVSGTAAVESISVTSPDLLRDHLLGEEFLDAANHPQLAFASKPAPIGDDGAITAEGELTIRGVTRPVVVTGRWSGPVPDPFGMTRAGLQLATTIDRRDYGMTFNLPMPQGGDALGYEVTITAEFELIADSE